MIEVTDAVPLYPKGYSAAPDNEKDSEDWAIWERITEFAQGAFNKHWLECERFLTAYRGGNRTSNDLHNMCQGYALALRGLQYPPDQSDIDAAQQYWDAEDKPDEIAHLAKAFARHRIAAEQRGKLEGARLALEAAAKDAEEWFPADTSKRYPSSGVVASIRALPPAKIVGEG